MKDKRSVLLGICGSIAVYKICDLIRLFKKSGINVVPIMTPDSTRFISPLLIESLAENRVYTSMFDESGGAFYHILLSRGVDLILIAPATANTIAKITSGLADNLLTSSVLASSSPVMIAPAMNVRMFENPITQQNIEKLKSNKRFHFIMPESGELACGDIGAGRLANIESIFDASMRFLSGEHILSRKRVLISAGPTREFMDPVRFLSNPSSGRMGYELARVAYWLGADVILVSGEVNIRPPYGVKVINVVSAMDMKNAILKSEGRYDMLIMTAAVSDWRFQKQSENKIKRGEGRLKIELVENSDIVSLAKKSGKFKFILGFAAETDNIYENASLKMKKKGLDAIFVNNVKNVGIGFGSEENEGSLIFKNGDRIDTGRSTKRELALNILFCIAERIKR